jgi:phage protein
MILKRIKLMTTNVQTTKVITGPNTRFSYLNANEPKSINGGMPKYSVSLIIPKDDTATIDKIHAAIELAYKEGEAKLKGNGKTVPALSVIKTPLRDGDLERPDDAVYQNAYFVNANSPHKPGVVDANRQEIIDTAELYSGIYGRASISFYAFNSNGNKGIACGLNNLQKLRDGEPLGGRTRAEDDFATEDDDDFLN